MILLSKKKLLDNTRSFFVIEIVFISSLTDMFFFEENLYVKYSRETSAKRRRIFSSYATFERYLILTLKSHKINYKISKDVFFYW